MDMAEQTEQRQVSQARVVFGLLIMLVGGLMLLDRLDWWGVRVNVPVWPWLLIVLGLVRLAGQSRDASGCTASRRTAMWLVFVGAWGLLNEYRLFGTHYGHSWPLLLIGAGVFVVWRALDPPPPRDPQRLHHD
jgi:LiaF transmembrane domain